MSNQVIELRAPDDVTQVGLAVVCDWHDGSPQFNERAAEEWVREIKDNRWYWIAIGDLEENALATSLGDVYTQTKSPMKQIDSNVERLKPICEYCLGMCGGNHGFRSVKATGLDPDQIIAAQLRVAYRPLTMYIAVYVGKTVWRIMAHHTTGGGRTMGGKLNALCRLAEVAPTMDLFIGGHSHANLYTTTSYQDFETGNNMPNGRDVVKLSRHFSGCGSLLEYDGSYAEAKMLAPAAQCQVVHFLGPRVHRAKVGMSKFTKAFDRRVYQY